MAADTTGDHCATRPSRKVGCTTHNWSIVTDCPARTPTGDERHPGRTPPAPRPHPDRAPGTRGHRRRCHAVVTRGSYADAMTETTTDRAAALRATIIAELGVRPDIDPAE